MFWTVVLSLSQRHARAHTLTQQEKKSPNTVKQFLGRLIIFVHLLSSSKIAFQLKPGAAFFFSPTTLRQILLENLGVCRVHLTKYFADILEIFTKISKPENWEKNYLFQLHLLFSFVCVCGEEWFFFFFSLFSNLFEFFSYFIQKKRVKFTGFFFSPKNF